MRLELLGDALLVVLERAREVRDALACSRHVCGTRGGVGRGAWGVGSLVELGEDDADVGAMCDVRQDIELERAREL